MDSRLRQFDLVRGQVVSLYVKTQYTEALDVLNSSDPATAAQAAWVPYAVAALQCRIGAPESAMRVLEDASREGLWWSPDQFEDDDDFEPLQQNPRYEDLMAAFRARLAESRRTAKSDVLVFEPPDGAADLLVALHAAGGNATDAATYWGPKQRWILALPQSSQISGTSSYRWDDQLLAVEEIAAAREHAARGHELRGQVIGGISQGGGLAIWSALAATPVEWLGFIAVCPGFRWIPDIGPLIPGAARRGVKGWIIGGSDDPALAQATAMHEACCAGGLSVKMDVVPDLGHEYPLDLSDRLPAILGWLTGRA